MPIFLKNDNHTFDLKGSGGNISPGSMAWKISLHGSWKYDALFNSPSVVVIISDLPNLYNTLSSSSLFADVLGSKLSLAYLR